MDWLYFLVGAMVLMPIYLGIREVYSGRKFFRTPGVERVDLQQIETLDQELLRDVTSDMVKAGLDPLAEHNRLGAVLIQFPWSFKATARSLEWLDDVTAAFSDYSLVVEVRHATWNRPEFYRWLAERGLGFVNIDQPVFSRSLGPTAEVSSRVGYVRLHGPGTAYQGQYNAGVLAGWAGVFRSWAGRGIEIFCYFDNDQSGYAVQDALRLKTILGISV